MLGLLPVSDRLYDGRGKTKRLDPGDDKSRERTPGGQSRASGLGLDQQFQSAFHRRTVRRIQAIGNWSRGIIRSVGNVHPSQEYKHHALKCFEFGMQRHSERRPTNNLRVIITFGSRYSSSHVSSACELLYGRYSLCIRQSASTRSYSPTQHAARIHLSLHTRHARVRG